MDRTNTIDNSLIERMTAEYGLPLHIIFTERASANTAQFREIAQKYYDNLLICFAVKSNPCRGAIRFAAGENIGLDVVSEYEFQTGLEEGIPPKEIVCNGNAKSDRYIEKAVKAGALIAVDGYEELDLVSQTAQRFNIKIKVLLRFAGMPLEGLTNADHSTASIWTKFGFSINEAEKIFDLASQMKGIDPAGISAHIGSQICDPSGYSQLMEHLLHLAHRMQVHGMKVNYINIGGGYPVSYLTADEWNRFKKRLVDQLEGRLQSDQWMTWDNIPMGFAGDRRSTKTWMGKAYWSKYPGAQMLEHLLVSKTRHGMTITEELEELGRPTLIVEPGRALFGTAGVTIAQVTGVKYVLGNHLVTLDMGIVNQSNCLITPDIHPVEVIPRHETDHPVEAFLAGRLCFSGDMISKVKIKLNRLPKRGELLLIHHTGTYSADHFASNCCGFPRPAKIAIHNDGSVEVWRRVDKYEDVFKL